MLCNIALALLLAAFALSAAAQTETEAPKYVLSSGISYDAVGNQASTVSTLGIKVAEIKGLPLYQLTTLETALLFPNTAATMRAGIWQTVYQTPSKQVSLGVCTDVGVMKTGDESTVGTFTGCGGLTWDVGARLTKGKVHVFLIPTVRIIAINGVQVKPSWGLRIGTGF